MKEIDCRGLSCPQPVLKTKKALEEAGATSFEVLVDNSNAVANVKRFAQSQGATVEMTEKGPDYLLTIKPGKHGQKASGKPDTYVVMITSETFGEGDVKLGRILMKSLLNTMWENETRPEKILFLNSGVRLTCEGSEVLDSLELLGEAGVDLVSCGTCLAFYEIADKLSIGHAGNMYEVVDSLLGAGKVIKI
ncbi:MAG: sulfurtransferase-like selenium metabolism protein YedF [Dehalococcoidaceae bacterium]|nr:sulfurtransferase-like selenium metabolism protein YedF [Dehalococcoidaceae bacterium]